MSPLPTDVHIEIPERTGFIAEIVEMAERLDITIDDFELVQPFNTDPPMINITTRSTPDALLVCLHDEGYTAWVGERPE